MNHIHSLLTIKPKGGARPKNSFVTRVYGHPNPVHRPEIWDLICNLGVMIDKPLVVYGDFNEILHLAEKWGGRARPKKQVSDFREVLTRCELRDARYVRSPFTWCNNRDNDNRIFERLDCFRANT